MRASQPKENEDPKVTYNRKWRQANREKSRINSRRNSTKYRTENREAWNEYFRKYYAEWVKDPINHACHNTRQWLFTVRKSLRTNQPSKSPLKLQIIDNLRSVGWTENLQAGMCLDHIVSLYWFYTFKLTIPRHIVYDKMNLRVISRVENSEIGNRTVTRKHLKLAEKLEQKYPTEMLGFAEFMKSKLGVAK